MAKYYFIVGSSAAGKSTTERNLRLRLSGELSLDPSQHIPDKDLIFLGRVIFANGKKVLRKSGGDSIWYKWELLLEAANKANNIIFEKYEVPLSVYELLMIEGHDVTLFHILIDKQVAVDRLVHIKHRNAHKLDRIYYKPGESAYQKARDKQLREWGVNVVYLSGDLKQRCSTIEESIGVIPMYDNVVYDFEDSLEDILHRFKSGGDTERPLNGMSTLNEIENT